MSTIKSSDEHLTLNADGSSKDIKFQANGVEKASISSAGAFTSTTIDATKLTGALPAISGAALTGVGVAGITSTADGTAITINATENVGIEVTPESWENNYPALQIGGAGALSGHSSGEVYITDNVYRNGGNWKHINTGAATFYQAAAGQHRFKTTPSASADANISWSTAMTIDNSGRATMPLQPAFSVARTGSNNSNGVLVYLNESFDTGGNYNTSNGKFTAPVAGKYLITFSGMTTNGNDLHNKWMRIRINGSAHKDLYFSTQEGHAQLSWSGVVHLASSDYVEIYNQDIPMYTVEAVYTSFTGFLLG